MTNDSNSLVIANILFRHKRSRSETWHSSKGVYFEHFILIQKRYQSSLNGPRTRAFPRADINGDSDLLIAIMKLALLSQKINQVTRAKYNFDKLKYLRIMEKFQATFVESQDHFLFLKTKTLTICLWIRKNYYRATTATQYLGREIMVKKPWITEYSKNLTKEKH